MDIGILIFILAQLTSFVAVPFLIVKGQKKIYEGLFYASKLYDCPDPLVAILAPRAPATISFFGTELPCIYPDISTPNLITSSTGQVIFHQISQSIQRRGTHGY